MLPDCKLDPGLKEMSASFDTESIQYTIAIHKFHTDYLIHIPVDHWRIRHIEPPWEGAIVQIEGGKRSTPSQAPNPSF